VDGKFGPETQSQLTKFQEENKLTSSVGKMDRYTAKKMAEILKSKNIPDSETLQSELGEI
jgi:peptidoglycan hydrolase-like protein with peptidoglycan-binding domain